MDLEFTSQLLAEWLVDPTLTPYASLTWMCVHTHVHRTMKNSSTGILIDLCDAFFLLQQFHHWVKKGDFLTGNRFQEQPRLPQVSM